MKILMAAPRLPYPPDKGDRLTVNRLLHYLSERHQLTLVTFLETDQNTSYINELRQVCQDIHVLPLRRGRALAACGMGVFRSKLPLQVSYYNVGAMHDLIRRLVQKLEPDLMYAHTIRMGQYLQNVVGPPKILAMQISMALNYRRLMESSPLGINQCLNRTEYKRVRYYEGSLGQNFDRCLLIGPADIQEVQKTVPLDNVFLNPHGVDTSTFVPPLRRSRSHRLVFTGNMGYSPNVDAILYFVHQIFPLVKQELRDVTLTIVGTNPTRAVRRLSRDPAISVTGRVERIQDALQQAAVAIAPMRIGAGLQNKVLEGMATGLPMVISPVANEGIRAVDSLHVYLAADPTIFAQRITELLQDPVRADEMGQAAHAFVKAQWTWEHHFATLEELMHDLVETSNA